MAWILYTLACSDHTLNPHAEGFGPEGWPNIVVEPERLDFGDLAGNETGTLEFTITNDGTEESVLDVSNIYLEAPESSRIYGYALLDDDELNLPYGQSATIRVSFTPEIPDLQEATVIIESNDDGDPRTPVLLAGRGLIPQLSISPNPLDVGTVNVGCADEFPITLTNVGTSELVLTSLAHSGGGFEMGATAELPLRMAPSESTEVRLTFRPTEETTYSSEIVAQSNEPHRERRGTQKGRGHVPTSFVDRFEIPSDPKTDILFFVDPSASMEDDQAALAENFQTFIASITDYTSNWQVMVVNADDGCGSEVLTSGTPDYQAKFAAAVASGDRNGMYAEAGLIVSTLALAQTSAGECNEGFLRSDALLHLIMVSDEPEQSPYDWTTYVEELRGLKASTDFMRVSAVAGPLPSGCEGDGNTATPGTGYQEAVNATGGVFLELCSDWANHVDELATATIIRKTYPLSATPSIPSIQVQVDGAASTRWDYNSVANEVSFRDGFEPHQGQIIQISYDEPLTCG